MKPLPRLTQGSQNRQSNRRWAISSEVELHGACIAQCCEMLPDCLVHEGRPTSDNKHIFCRRLYVLLDHVSGHIANAPSPVLCSLVQRVVHAEPASHRNGQGRSKQPLYASSFSQCAQGAVKVWTGDV